MAPTRKSMKAAQAAASASPAAQTLLSSNARSHMISRFGFGPTPQDLTATGAFDPDAWWADQIQRGRASAGYAACSWVGQVGPLLSQSSLQVQTTLRAQNRSYAWDALDQLSNVTLGLNIWSDAQLYEAIVAFFANHLNVANHNTDVWTTRHAFDRDVIRKFAFGTYTDMLTASAKHPAMMLYLNLAESKAGAINENYARELLELHTVGPGYSEADVQNCARILTGLRIDPSTLTTIYSPADHALGPVQVLNFADDNADSSAGLDLINRFMTYLATHPNTAQNLATKLCRRFVSDAPSASLIRTVAKAYLDSGCDILSTVATIARNDEFWAARGKKVRQPAENMIAAMRALGTTPSVPQLAATLRQLYWALYLVSAAPLDAATPNGYVDAQSRYGSASCLTQLWWFHRQILRNEWQGFVTPGAAALLGQSTPLTAGDAITTVCKALTGSNPRPEDVSTLARYCGEQVSAAYATSQTKQKLPAVVALLLDSPYHALR